MMKEYDLVVLCEDHPEVGLFNGDVGTIVLVHEHELAYEVEFVAGDGTTLGLLSLPASKIRPIEARELLHTRRC